MTCSVCGKEIDPTTPDVWQKVVGWERHRTQGGTNAIAFRQPLQVWMCGECYTRKKYGSNQGEQGKLL